MAGAQIELAALIAELARNGASTADASSHLQSLARLQQQLGTADRSALATLGREITAAIAATDHLVTQGRGTAERARDAAESMAEMAELAAEARQQVTGLLRDMHQFDALLEFDSAAQEQDYRRREAERRAAIEAELAKGTLQGDLNASGIMAGQMTDAAAHGAAGDPEFDKRFDALIDSTRNLRDQIARDGGDVEKFNADRREDLRAIMRAKGKSDAEIDAHLAAHPDPLDAMRAFAAEQKGALSTRDLETVEASVKIGANNAEIASQIEIAEQSSTLPPTRSIADVMAKLSASGVVMAEQENGAPLSHGVTAQAISATAPSRSV